MDTFKQRAVLQKSFEAQVPDSNFTALRTYNVITDLWHSSNK